MHQLEVAVLLHTTMKTGACCRRAPPSSRRPGGSGQAVSAPVSWEGKPVSCSSATGLLAAARLRQLFAEVARTLMMALIAPAGPAPARHPLRRIDGADPARS